MNGKSIAFEMSNDNGKNHSHRLCAINRINQNVLSSEAVFHFVKAYILGCDHQMKSGISILIQR